MRRVYADLPEPAYSTELGSAYSGDALELLPLLPERSVADPETEAKASRLGLRTVTVANPLSQENPRAVVQHGVVAGHGDLLTIPSRRPVRLSTTRPPGSRPR